jgi:putative ABC transport system ATP-binding protein
MLQLKDIHKSYSLTSVSVEILKGVNLEVGEGEFLSIVGSSGCGKSTLMNIIGLLDTPTRGSYFIDNKKTDELKDSELARIRNKKVGFVFQQFHLLPKLNALDNICLPLVYRQTKASIAREKAMEMLEKVGMKGMENHKPNELSGGQQQRIAIARALSANPSIILADEPTGALDMKTGQEIMDLFLALNKKENITIVLITHDLKIADQCKRIVRMKDGILT